MPLSLIRIDDRLIHGQVVQGWVPVLGIGKIIVISDEAAKDQTQAALWRLSCPEDVSLSIVSRLGAAQAVRLAKTDEANVLALLPSPKELLSLLESGEVPENVNVGGFHFAAAAFRLGASVRVSAADLEAFREASRRGVRFEGRAVPGDRPIDVLEPLLGSSIAARTSVAG